MSSTDNTRRHRAGENPDGRPVRDLVDEYYRAPVRSLARQAAPA